MIGSTLKVSCRPFCLLMAFLMALSCSLSVGVGPAAAAQSGLEIAADAQQVVEQFQPWTEGQLQPRAQNLAAALHDLQHQWSTKNPERFSGWREYLLLDDLQAEFNLGLEGDLYTLRTVLARFYHSHVGLELPELRAVRAALRGYVAALELIQHDDQQQLVAERLQPLLSLSPERDWSDLSVEESVAIGEAHAWLVDTGMAAELTDKIAAGFGHANARVTISKNFVPQHLLKEVSETTPIRESIDGVAVRGNAVTRAQPRISLIPNELAADVRLVLTGETNARATSQQRRVKVQSTLVTRHLASKQLQLNNEVLESLPATFQGRTSGQIQSVNVDRVLGKQLIESVAWNKAREMMPAAERRTTNKINQQVTARLDNEVNEIIKKLNQFYTEFVSGPLTRLGFRPAIVGTRTTTETLDVTLRAARLNQLSSPSSAPYMPAGADVGLAIHESFVPNVFDVLTGGLRMSDEEVERFIEVSFKRTPRALKTNVNTDSWDFVFAERSPVTFRFRDGQVGVMLHMQEFNRRLADPADESVQSTRGMIRAEATYRYELNGTMDLFRVGDVVLESEQEIPTELRAFMQSKLEAVFANEYRVPPIELPAVMSPGAPQALKINYATSNDGWLNIGWWLHASGPATATASR